MTINQGILNHTHRRDTVTVTIDEPPRHGSCSTERSEQFFMTPQSRSVQEADSSLQFSNHFHGVNGFILKYNHSTSPDISCPSKITIIAGSHVASSKSMWTFDSSGKLGILDLKQGGQEVLSFTYQLQCQVFGRAEKRVAHIYLHRQNESCGKVECTEDGLKATINDYASESSFTLSQITMSPTPKIEIQDISGNVVGLVVGLRGKKNLRRHITWTEFKFTYSPSSHHTLPASVKAVLAVAFFMWVFIYQEKKAGKRRLATRITLFFLSLFLGLPIAVITLYGLFLWIREEYRNY